MAFVLASYLLPASCHHPSHRRRCARNPGQFTSEEIARLVGHSSTRVTETVYRRELRPVITTGAEVTDELFGLEPDPG
ncbi:MAG TPA: hypothetical protein VEF71_13065, partial [Streptosporangiaceae bacterium]|nr:hypothetical protein [Streptosporangiaceae bacterium]